MSKCEFKHQKEKRNLIMESMHLHRHYQAQNKLRDYQLIAFNEIIRRIESGTTTTLVISPTGSGKTVIGCHLASHFIQKGKRCLWLAHRRELIQQASEKIKKEYQLPHGVIQAGVINYYPNSYLQIASIQTLQRANFHHSFDVIIIDEAHHATAESYLSIISSNPNAVIIGLTATPWRLTGKSLNHIFMDTIVVANYKKLIEEKHLVNPIILAPSFDVLNIHDNNSIVGDVVVEWGKYSATPNGIRSSIVFAKTIEHSKMIVRDFRRNGIVAEHLDATTSDQERSAMLKRLNSGKTTIISNVNILTEGFDCPRVSCICIARPTESKTLYIQMIGRGMRPHLPTKKRNCIILDHTNGTQKFGNIAKMEDYSLSDDDTETEDLIGCEYEKKCKSCNSSIPAGCMHCPICGITVLNQEIPLHIDGSLVPFADIDIDDINDNADNSDDNGCALAIPNIQAKTERNILLEHIIKCKTNERFSHIPSIAIEYSKSTATAKRDYIYSALNLRDMYFWVSSIKKMPNGLESIGLGYFTEISNKHPELSDIIKKQIESIQIITLSRISKLTLLFNFARHLDKSNCRHEISRSLTEFQAFADLLAIDKVTSKSVCSNLLCIKKIFIFSERNPLISSKTAKQFMRNKEFNHIVNSITLHSRRL